MLLVHTVFCDIDGRNDFNAIGQGIREGDGGIGLGFRIVIIYDHVEIATIHLINMILLQKSPFRGIEFEICAPIIHSIPFLKCSWGILPCATSQHYQQTD